METPDVKVVRRRTPNGSPAPTTVNLTPATQEPIDQDGIFYEYEFGGPVGVIGMMTFFPLLFYYLYVCLYFYDGSSFSLHHASAASRRPDRWPVQIAFLPTG